MFVVGNEEADWLIRSKMTKLVGKGPGGVWQCLECSFEAEVNKLYKHVESSHVNVTFYCNFCQKPCKNRGTLLTHKSRHHRGQHSF